MGRYRKYRTRMQAGFIIVLLAALSGISIASFGGFIGFKNEGPPPDTEGSFRWNMLLHPEELNRYTEKVYSGSAIATYLRYWNLMYLSDFFLFGTEGFVVPGKGGMLFAFNDEQKEFFLRTPPFSSAELDEWTKVIEQRRRWLALNEMAYYFLVVPNKSTLYPERVPSHYKALDRPNRFDQLQNHLRETTGFQFIDIRDDLRSHKNGHLLYSLGDTHWNLYGAYLGYAALMRHLKDDFPQIFVLPEEDLRMRSRETDRSELGRMLQVNPLLKDEVLYYLPDYPPNYEKQDVPRSYFSHSWPWHPEEVPSFAHATEAPEVKSPSVAVFHDSFFRAMFFYTSESFGRVLYVWNKNRYPGESPTRLDFRTLERERPSIVIEESVERFFSYGPPENPVSPVDPSQAVARLTLYDPVHKTAETKVPPSPWIIRDVLYQAETGASVLATGGWEGGSILTDDRENSDTAAYPVGWEIHALTRFNGDLYATGRDGLDGIVAVSRDKGRWETSARFPATYLCASVVHDRRLFVAGENGKVFHSADGQSWSEIHMDGNRYIRSLESGNGRLCAVGDEGLIAFLETSGKWNILQADFSFNWKQSVHREGVWVITGGNGSEAFSLRMDTQSTLLLSNGFGMGDARSILFAHDRFWTLTTHHRSTLLFSSDNGLDWVEEEAFPALWGEGMRLVDGHLLIWGMERQTPSAPPEINRDLWLNVWDIGDGSEYLSWCGFFDNIRYPWIYHFDMGWFRTSEGSEDLFWIYFPDLGWFKSSKEQYPVFISAEDGQTYRLVGGSAISTKTGQPMVPKAGPDPIN